LREHRDVKSLNGKPSPQNSGGKATGSNDSRLGYGGTVVKHLTDGLQLHDKIKSELISDLIANIYGSEEKDLSLFDASHIQLSDERRKKLEQMFISRLCYDTMQERELTIKDAHKGTLRWIFEENDTTGFKNWLVSDKPLYWITGKPGSGKSTLMKYLLRPVCGSSGGNNRASIATSTDAKSATHTYSRCAKYLRKWAGNDNDLTIVSFHFWAVGSELQSSQEGLLRTLLVQLLRAHPEVIPVVAPLRWESLYLFNTDPRNFSLIDLGDIFKKAIIRISTRAKLAIFIDGLDEFEGNSHTLISLIQSCVSSPIKVCVSSRPWNEFEDAFGECPRLQMQDLTHQDISNYVSSKFEADVQFQSLQRRQPRVAAEFRETIVKKSSGVFLWVTIVVTSLLAGIQAGDRVEDLQERLDQLPEEIEDLYKRILEDVDWRYREHTAQLLQLMSAFKTPPSPLLFWYADEVNFMDRAIKENSRTVLREEALDRVEDIRRRLKSRCKGLLEIHEATAASSHPFDPHFGGHVDYLHKTVYEFISREKTQQRFQSYLKTSYDAHLRIAAAYATLTKDPIHQADGNNLNNTYTNDPRSLSLMRCLGYAADVSHESKNEVVRLLDHLTGVCRDIPRDIWYSVADTRPYVTNMSPALLWAENLVYLDRCGDLDPRQKLLCLACSLSVVEYVKARAGPGGLVIVQPSALDISRDGLANLIGRVFDKWSGNRKISLLSLVCLSNPNGASILKHLLEKGAKPNMRFKIIDRGFQPKRLTPWEEILAKALGYCAVYQEGDRDKYKDTDNVLRCVRQMVDGGAKVNPKTVKTAKKEAKAIITRVKPDAKLNIDREGVYQCLKKMKVDPDAQLEPLSCTYLGDYE